MAGAVRFSTDELADLASRIAEAGEQSLALEKALFDEMTALALENAEPLSAIAGALAAIDVSVSLAELAVAARYVRPGMDNGLGFQDRARPSSGGGSGAGGGSCPRLCPQ